MAFNSMVVLIRLFIFYILYSTAFELPKFFSNKPLSKALINDKPKEIRLPDSDRKYFWDLSKVAFSLLPIYPSVRRKTIVEEVVPNQIWTLDQLQGIISVNVPVRSVVVKLKAGGLFVYNPVAPTLECIQILRDLEQKHGEVKFIILGTVGLEHKAFLGPFCNYFPVAKVFVNPGQWSFPINLPDAFLGFPVDGRVNLIPPHTGTSSSTSSAEVEAAPAPWAADFDHLTLGPLRFKSVGSFSETAFYHRTSRTLLLTDSIQYLTAYPPPILTEDPRSLLYHSRDAMLDVVQDTAASRQRGWQRMLLFGLVFYPAGITVSLAGLWTSLRQVGQLSKASQLLGQGAVPINGGFYPWQWPSSDRQLPNVAALSDGLLVAPILRELIFNREPSTVLAWVNQVSRWPFRRIISAHLGNDIPANSQAFNRAFDFLRPDKAASRSQQGKQPKGEVYALEEDLRFLRFLSELLTKLGVVAPSAV